MALFLFFLLLHAPLPARAQDFRDLPDDARIKAQRLKYEKNRIIASGDVHILHKGAMLRADELEYDEKARIIKAEGNVRMTQGGENVYGDSLLYDTEAGRATLWNARGSTSRIETNRKKMTENLFFWGRNLGREKSYMRIEKGIFTTCDLPKPEYHYHFTAREAVIYPEDRMVARHVGIHSHDRLLLNRPLLILSLKKEDRRQNYIPQAGFSNMDGYYVKESIFIQPRKGDEGRVNLDWYQKTGIGGGLDYNYQLGQNGRGMLHWYQLSPNATGLVQSGVQQTSPSVQATLGKNEFSNYLNYNLPGNLNFGLGYSSYAYSYPQTGSISWNSNSLYLGKYTEKYNYAITQGITNYQNLNYISRTLDYGYRFNKHLRMRTGGIYSSQNEGEYLDTLLSYKNTSGSSVFFMDKLPELTFLSKRLSLADVPLNAVMSVGNYREEPTHVQMNRTNLQVSTRDLSWPVGDNGHFDVGCGIRQLYYQNNGAQYVVAGGAGLFQDYGGFGTRLNYYYQRPEGYTPFLTDQVGKYNLVTGGIDFRAGEKCTVGFFSGFDMNSNNFHSLIGRLAITPTKYTRLDFGSNYDLQRNTWVNVNSQIGLDLGDGLSLNHWIFYDMMNKKYTYQDFCLSKETHDFLTRVVYRSEQQEFWLQFALKAFPNESVSIGADPERLIMPLKFR